MEGRIVQIVSWMSAVLIVSLATLARGQEQPDEPPPYSGLRAGEEARQLAEEQRQQRLNDQLYLNDAMRARYGWAPSGSVVWYGNAGVGFGPTLGIDYAYAYSSDRLFGHRRGLLIERHWSPPLAVFEPWPYIPGDIYGYSFPPFVRQSIGQRQIQTGPNRWESHPVYPEDREAGALTVPSAPAPAAAEHPAGTEPASRKPRRRAF